MHYAAQQGDVDVIQQLINRGYTVNCMNYELVTPLHEAATAGHAQACSYLLDEGAWVCMPSNKLHQFQPFFY